MNKINKVLVLISIFIVLGLLLRSVEVISGNYVFGFDQGLFYKDVKVFMDSNKLPLIGAHSPLPGVFQHPAFYWLLSIFYILFNSDPYGGMVMMFIVSALGLLICYPVCRLAFDKNESLIILILYALSYSVSHSARILWPPLPIYFISIFYFVFVKKVLDGEFKYFPFVFFALGLITAFEIAAGVIIMIPTAVILFLFARKSFTFKNIALSGISVGVLFSPLLIFSLRHENIIINGIISFLRGDVVSGQAMPLIERIFSHLNSFIYNFKIFQTQTEFNVIIFPLAAIIIGSYLLMIKRNKFVIFVLLLNLFTFIEMLLFKSMIWQWYLLPLTVGFIFILGVSIAGNLNSKVKLLSFLSFSLLVIIFAESIIRLNTSFRVDLFDKGGMAKVEGKREALEFIYNDSKGSKFDLKVFSPPVYTHPYDYLVDTYFSEKYKYKPEDGSEIKYLLIESDFYQPWTYQGWLESGVGDGELIFEKRLDSGFIIQKLKIDI